MQPKATDPRKWMLGAIVLTLVLVVGLLGYLRFHSPARVETTYTVASHYVARNFVDLSRMPDSTFFQLTDSDHVRVLRDQGSVSMVEILDGEFRGQQGWVQTGWLQEAR